ncbi:hypothetical protein [Streptomyces sp. NPDC093591]
MGSAELASPSSTNFLVGAVGRRLFHRIDITVEELASTTWG